ncbi:MAG: aminomethyl-transferring glycine dehydrogenase subunit GcvPB [Kiritimatiellota bacterium]|nr:aminomethyl-transferring glycine dehydrogenase subunit GcvPB [Kiritimatiellota bacterium]
MKLIYEKSVAGRRAVRAPRRTVPGRELIQKRLLRARPAELPEVPEIEVVRHFTNLSRLNFSVDTQFYPLGSCTMKYNPKACEVAAQHPGFVGIHPLWPQLRGGGQLTQGALRLLYETERLLAELTGMAEFTLQPLAGAHGELTGAMLIAAYHRDRGNAKKHILIPDSAHGTNPASAALAGFQVVAAPSTAQGTVDVEKLKGFINAETAGMMMTNPNTLGLFEPDVRRIADLIHAVDGLLYYDGANFNAIMGRCKPAEMGFDVCHLNPHKSFAAPHGGGGPGAGPVGVVERLRPFLPISRVVKTRDGTFSLDYDYPKSIGYVAPFYGNFGVLVRTYAYLLLLGREGLRAVSDHAVLNANYVLSKLKDIFPAVSDHCMHECVLSAKSLVAGGVRAMDIAKGLIDRGFHPPTVYFPLIVPEAMMIEPTETETRETLDAFIQAMRELAQTARANPAELHAAPVTTTVGRLDEVAAARNMDLAFEAGKEEVISNQ